MNIPETIIHDITERAGGYTVYVETDAAVRSAVPIEYKVAGAFQNIFSVILAGKVFAQFLLVNADARFLRGMSEAFKAQEI